MKGKEDCIDSLHQILIALNKEYVIDRKLYLQISPNLYTNISNYSEMINVFKENKFQFTHCEDRTLFLDLEASELALRNGFNLKWRNWISMGIRNCRISQYDLSLDCF